MIGVVIWSSAAAQNAVIWCEDQGPLAYLQCGKDLLDGGEWPVPGDILSLDCDDTDRLRRALRVRLMATEACPQLPAALRGETNRPASHLTLVESPAQPSRSPVVRRIPPSYIGSVPHHPADSTQKRPGQVPRDKAATPVRA